MNSRWIWWGSSPAVMGIGIWSMHFTGMLVFSLPVPVACYWPEVLRYLVVASIGHDIGLSL